jgi:flagellar hook-length control protein FliK
VTVQVHAELGSGGWANELGTRLHWMANQGIGSASLHLTPEQLGPVEVKISLHQNAASVWFSAAQPDTRSALEQALPRLRELFSAQGLNLAQAGVSDQSAQGAQREPQRPPAGARTGAAAHELSVTSITSASRAHQGLIDTYA